MKQLVTLFSELTGRSAPNVTALPSSGSNRKYFRLSDKSDTFIGVVGQSVEENRAFVSLSRHFASRGLNVPSVLAVSADEMSYLQEDLGDVVLFDEIKAGRLSGVFSHHEKELLHKTIISLADFQCLGAKGLDFGVCFPQSQFDRRSVHWDLNYFKYNFLKLTSIEFSEDRLETDFERFADRLLGENTDTFMYRDFQSRNVMIRDSSCWFIDYQGGRRGPVYYDVASFLWQAKANYSAELRMELLDSYISSLSKYMTIDRSRFEDNLRQFVLFRTLQVLGAYGFRGFYEKKPHFIQSIPFAINNLREILREGFDEYPYLSSLLKAMTELKQFDGTKEPNLEVRVMSFAYKKGIPDDPSGNGGGYVFDCRAINNPGKYERYNNSTGLDNNVKEFLEDDGEILVFLDSVRQLVDSHVKRYLERKFTNLSVAFGCTGGRHRSVYAAQHIAEHISQKFQVKVNLIHREQNIEQRL